MYDYFNYAGSLDGSSLIYEYGDGEDDLSMGMGFYDYSEVENLIERLEEVVYTDEISSYEPQPLDNEEETQTQTVERVQMQPYFERRSVNWQDTAEVVLQNSDVNFDSIVTAEELTDALFWEFGINANQKEREFVNRSLSEVCTWYQSLGMDQDTLESCLRDYGDKIWTSITDWAANRAGEYNPAMWTAILSDADKDGDE